MTIEHPTRSDAAPGQAPDPERFFADHYLPVMRLCMRHLGDENDAEDAAQEVFRRAVQRSAELRGDPLPWLITVARNICRDELRRRNGRAAAPVEDTSPADPAVNPERVVVGELFVRELLGRLTPAERRVVAARVYDGATGADAAQALGVSSSTTRVLLARARHKLRRYLEEGQAVFALLPALGARSLHSLRRHLLERPWAGEAGAALALPAALLVTAMMTPALEAPTPAHPLPTLATLGPSAASLHDTHALGASVAADNNALVRRQSPGTTRSTAPPAPPNSGGSTLLPSFTPTLDSSMPLDIEPSPNYSQDHTVLMLGESGTCNPPYCTQLYRSADGGATWTYVGAPGLAGLVLVLPPASFAQGTFYAWNALGLEMTTNGGATFVNAMPSVGGYPAAAPAWSNLGVLVSNDELWQVSNGQTPKPLSLFNGGESAIGAPLTVPDGHGGARILQPVSDSIAKQTMVLSCTRTCSTATELPFYSTRTAVIASPNEATDHTVYAVGYGSWIVVSHDDGQTFGPRFPLVATQLIAVPHNGGRRLVALVQEGTNWAMRTSDDDGMTWQEVTLDPNLNAVDNAMRISSLSSGRMIASLQRRDRPDRFAFACSIDGGYWTSCAPDTAR